VSATSSRVKLGAKLIFERPTRIWDAIKAADLKALWIRAHSGADLRSGFPIGVVRISAETDGVFTKMQTKRHNSNCEDRRSAIVSKRFGGIGMLDQ